MNEIARIKELKRTDITIRRVLKAIIRRITYIPSYLTWKLPFPFSKMNKTRLKQFHNIHKGKRCFIIANGPSLKKINFELLRDEYTIGMNRIYLMEKVNGFLPTYLVCIDKEAQLTQFLDEYEQLKLPVFFNWDLHKLFSKKPNQYFIKGKFGRGFTKNIVNKRFGTGLSVTYYCMQLAFYMGFDEVYLIGKDHSYNTSEKATTTIKSNGLEDNHFIKGYYKPNQIWFAPDYNGEEYAYKLAKVAFEEDGRIIKDATIEGKLNVFEKVEFNYLFKKEK